MFWRLDSRQSSNLPSHEFCLLSIQILLTILCPKIILGHILAYKILEVSFLNILHWRLCEGGALPYASISETGSCMINRCSPMFFACGLQQKLSLGYSLPFISENPCFFLKFHKSSVLLHFWIFVFLFCPIFFMRHTNYASESLLFS